MRLRVDLSVFPLGEVCRRYGECVKNTGLRTVLALAAALAVIYFGSGPNSTHGLTNSLIVLAVAAGLAVWFLTKPGTGKPVS